MTLLILGIDVPENIPGNQADQALIQHFVGLVPQFLVYALAFFNLGSIWYAHKKHFRHMKMADGRLIWNNILGFMFIALIPFTTNWLEITEIIRWASYLSKLTCSRWG